MMATINGIYDVTVTITLPTTSPATACTAALPMARVTTAVCPRLLASTKDTTWIIYVSARGILVPVLHCADRDF
jgi:hypothetical protein